MARTRPQDARRKILAAEQLRCQELQQTNAIFRRDLDRLMSIAKRISGLTRDRVTLDQNEHVEVAEGVFIPKELLPTPAEEEFNEAAARFQQEWNVRPTFADDGTVSLLIRMPVSYQTLPTGELIEVTRRGKYHPDGDVDALAKRYRSLRQLAREKREEIRNYMQEQNCNYATAKDAIERAGGGLKHMPTSQPARRRRIDTENLRLKARELSGQGKTLAQIAKALFPKEYRAAVKRDPQAEEKLRSLAPKYMEPPHNLTWPEAERKAASELGVDLRPRSVKIEKLTRRVRYLLLDK
jgi:hypothetical protein